MGAVSAMLQPRVIVTKPVRLKLFKLSEKKRVPAFGEPFACWIDGQAIDVTHLTLNLSQPVLDFSMASFSSVIQYDGPTSWKLEGELAGDDASLNVLLACQTERRASKVEFVNVNSGRSQRFKSEGIVTQAAPNSLGNYTFELTGTAELVETHE